MNQLQRLSAYVQLDWMCRDSVAATCMVIRQDRPCLVKIIFFEPQDDLVRAAIAYLYRRQSSATVDALNKPSVSGAYSNQVGHRCRLNWAKSRALENLLIPYALAADVRRFHSFPKAVQGCNPAATHSSCRAAIELGS